MINKIEILLILKILCRFLKILSILKNHVNPVYDFLRRLRANCISTNLTTRIQINAAAKPAITSVV